MFPLWPIRSIRVGDSGNPDSVLTMLGQLQGRVTVRVADSNVGTFALPTWGTASVGRTDGYAFQIPHSWAPQKVCRFMPIEFGWVVQVGPTPRMEVQDKYVGKHVFNSRSMVVLQPGQSYMTFPELDDHIKLGVVISLDAAEGLEEIRDREVEDAERVGTSYAVSRVSLTQGQRTAVAATCAYMLTGAPKPTNLTATAAVACGRSEAAIKKDLGKVINKVNAERWGPKLKSYEQLGVYLTQTSRFLTLEDVPQSLR